MNLTEPRVLKTLLKRYGITPQKRFGQHYLCSAHVVDKIVESVGEVKGILEVGPGPGILTHALSTKCEQYIAIEIDPKAVLMLSETAPTAQIILGDVLQFDLKEIIEKLPIPRALVSNMPYQITGPLLGKFAELRNYYTKAVLMMQKEVGERVLAIPGTKNHGSLSVFLQSQFKIKKLLNVSAGSFLPPPKVESVVLELIPKLTGLSFNQESLFFKFVRVGFTHPRKTLANNLASGFKKERVKIEMLLKENGLEILIRPHQLNLENWRTLFENYEQQS